jgi:hypothetical protein
VSTSKRAANADDEWPPPCVTYGDRRLLADSTHERPRPQCRLLKNAAAIRAQICAGLEWAGLELDAARNAATVGGREGPISPGGARLAAWVIPTDEELLIARDTFRVVSGIEARY